jgi:ATP-dependent DNA helicase RecG
VTPEHLHKLLREGEGLTVETNLIEGYDLLMKFIEKHTLDRFFLINDQRVSVRTWIAREVVSNILVHKEYSSTFPAKIIIERDRLYAENWNRSDLHGAIDPNDFSPQPKNPILSRFFVNIGRADQLGSGVRNLYKYTKMYSGREPELIEGDVFKTIVPLVDINNEAFDIANGTINDTFGTVNGIDGTINGTINGIGGTINGTGGSGGTGSSFSKDIVTLIKDNNRLTIDEIAQVFLVSRRTVSRELAALKEQGLLFRVGSNKSGHWEVIDRED